MPLCRGRCNQWPVPVEAVIAGHRHDKIDPAHGHPGCILTRYPSFLCFVDIVFPLRLLFFVLDIVLSLHLELHDGIREGAR